VARTTATRKAVDSFKAEKRGFAPGDELRDWAEAEKEIDKLIFG
jgi:hypothetical protein